MEAGILHDCFEVVNLTISGMNYNPDLEGPPVVQNLRLGVSDLDLGMENLRHSGYESQETEARRALS
ncbi:rCG59236 [Rattus norvegicus]|uniref:RCG59236 n=1 Tax=Rattus norvegicus TaxID=10116 RepID=A6K7H4_RAT|nr:rCG59236 [Rattus norvegicus]